MFALVVFPFFLIGLVSLTSYFVLCYYMYSLKDQDLRKKYSAEWGLVTGGSSGIGLSLVRKLASQGVNVVIVALKDDLLTKAVEAVSKEFPKIKVRSAGVNLGSSDPDMYMKPIIDATKDIQVSLVFNNAGYIYVNLFHKVDIKGHIANYNCNATSALYITHHFAQKLVESGKKGLITFTSSSGGFFPSPLTSMYASTKSFLSTFAASIAVELKNDNIDVVVVHPSPVDTNFYNNASLLDIVKFFQKRAVSPSVIADIVFAAAGRVVVVDQGFITMVFRTLLKIVDWTLIAQIMSRTSSGMINEFQKKK